MAAQAMAAQELDVPLVAPPAEADPIRLRLLQGLSSRTLSRLLALETEAFPECERLGNFGMQEHAMQRTAGLLVAEPDGPPPPPEPDPMGFLIYTRTGDAGIIMKLAVGAAFRGRGVGRALLRFGISELRRPTRRAPPSTIMLHVDPSRTAARGLYESMGFVQEQHLTRYYADGRDALLMKLRS